MEIKIKARCSFVIEILSDNRSGPSISSPFSLRSKRSRGTLSTDALARSKNMASVAFELFRDIAQLLKQPRG